VTAIHNSLPNMKYQLCVQYSSIQNCVNSSNNAQVNNKTLYRLPVLFKTTIHPTKYYSAPKYDALLHTGSILNFYCISQQWCRSLISNSNLNERGKSLQEKKSSATTHTHSYHLHEVPPETQRLAIERFDSPIKKYPLERRG